MYKGLLYGGIWKTFKSYAAYREYMQTNPEQVAARSRVEAEKARMKINDAMKKLEKAGLTGSPAYKQARAKIQQITGKKGATRITQSALKRRKTSISEVRGAYEYLTGLGTFSVKGAESYRAKQKSSLEKTLGLKKPLTQKVFNQLFEVYNLMTEMYYSILPPSSETMQDISEGLSKKQTPDNIINFADEINKIIDDFPALEGYKRQMIEQGLQDFANGKKPEAYDIAAEYVKRAQEKLNKQIKSSGDLNNFPYKGSDKK